MITVSGFYSHCRRVSGLLYSALDERLTCTEYRRLRSAPAAQRESVCQRQAIVAHEPRLDRQSSLGAPTKLVPLDCAERVRLPRSSRNRPLAPISCRMRGASRLGTDAARECCRRARTRHAMDIFGSALAYLGSIVGLVVGLPVLGYMFLATPRSATPLRDAPAVTQSEAKPHKVPLLRLHKTSSHGELITGSPR